jgi:2-alkyl-3-oxoalkanoate reductase
VKILVTGSGGFLGGYVLGEIAARGHQVVALVRPGSTLSPASAASHVDVLETDLRAPSDLLDERLRSCDAVIHLAAGTRGGWRGALETTVVATANLLGAMDRIGWTGRLVHASSFSVYGLNQLRAGTVVDEDTPLEPDPGRRDAYAWCKALQERQMAEARDAGRDVAIVRPGAIFGPERRFQYRLGREIGDHGLLLIGGTIPMPLVYAGNVASLMVECAVNPRASGQVFNAVDTPVRTQFAYLRRLLGSRPGRTVVVPVPAALLRWVGLALDRQRRRSDGRVKPPAFLDPYVMTPMFRRFRYRPSRAENVLGWRPPTAMDEALDITFAPLPRTPQA